MQPGKPGKEEPVMVEEPTLYLGLTEMQLDIEFAKYLGRNGYFHRDPRTERLVRFLQSRASVRGDHEFARKTGINEIVWRAFYCGHEPIERVQFGFLNRIAESVGIPLTQWPLQGILF